MPKQILLCQITSLKVEELFTAQKIGRALASKKAIGGTWCMKEQTGEVYTLSFYDCYSMELISSYEICRHLLRKCCTTIFGDGYMNRIIKIR